jgi:hypothetical protein
MLIDEAYCHPKHCTAHIAKHIKTTAFACIVEQLDDHGKHCAEMPAEREEAKHADRHISKLTALSRAANLYSFPGLRTLSFERDAVLNHRLNGRSVLLPGDELEGLLMAIGEGPLPNEFHDRERFSTILSAYYGRWKRCDLQVDLMVSRQTKQKTSQTPSSLQDSNRMACNVP